MTPSMQTYCTGRVAPGTRFCSRVFYNRYLVKFATRRLLLIAIAAAFIGASAQPAAADEIPEVPPPLPVVYDAVAEVQITYLQHSLRASDARRVAYGAAPPLIPYNALLTVHRTCPKIKLPRLKLEGIVSTGWMPAQNSRGILLVARNGEEYLPVAPFPCQGFLPEQDCGGKRAIEFPPESGYLASFDRVWACLCDLQAVRTGTLPEARLETWRGIFRNNAPEEAVVALFLLLNIPETLLSRDLFSARLLPDGENGPAPLPLAPAAQLFAVYLAPDHCGPVLELVLEAAPRADIPDERARLAQACLDLANRAPETERCALLEMVFAREWDHGARKTALIPVLAPVTSFFADAAGGAPDPLLTRLLKHPSRFPALRRYDDLASFWKLLAKRGHPKLPCYLRRFMDRPTAEFLGIPLTPTALDDLVRLATTLTAASADVAGPS